MSRYNSRYFTEKRKKDLPFECGAKLIYLEGYCVARVRNKGEKCKNHMNNGRRRVLK
jgi:hypothetical protein